MLTITEEAEGRGSLGKVTAGRELHKHGPQKHGRGGHSISGYAALIIYHSISLGKKRKPAIDYMHRHYPHVTHALPPTPRILPSTHCVHHVKQCAHTIAFLHCYAPLLVFTVANSLVSNNVTPSGSRVAQRAHISLQGCMSFVFDTH